MLPLQNAIDWLCFACKATARGKRDELEPCICGCPDSWIPYIARARARELTRELASDVPVDSTPRYPTLEPELDDALGGGLAWTSTALAFGVEGVGKTRAMLRIVSRIRPALVISLEMPKRLCVDTAASAGADRRGFYVVEDLDDWEHEAEGCRAILLDSISVAPHPVSLLRKLRDWATRTTGTVVAICQANARGAPLGPRALRHWPDYVFRFSGARAGFVRMSWKKSRYCAPGGALIPIIELPEDVGAAPRRR